MADSKRPEDDEPEILDGSQALANLNLAEINQQVSTAKRYPRSISAFMKQATEMATLDQETAGSMFYALPRAGKIIEGPSVRLAEVVASAWGNLRFGAQEVEVGDKFVTARGFAYDLEKNTACAFDVRRRITDKFHRRYDEDMIGVTSRAAAAIAFRTSIFKIVPMSYVKNLCDAAKQASLGKAMTMEQRRTRVVEWFAKLGATPDKVLLLVHRAAMEDVTIDDLIVLQGIRTALMDGEISLETALRQSAGGDGRPSSLLDAVVAAAASKKPPGDMIVIDGKTMTAREAPPPAAEQASESVGGSVGSSPSPRPGGSRDSTTQEADTPVAGTAGDGGAGHIDESLSLPREEREALAAERAQEKRDLRGKVERPGNPITAPAPARAEVGDVGEQAGEQGFVPAVAPSVPDAASPPPSPQGANSGGGQPAPAVEILPEEETRRPELLARLSVALEALGLDPPSKKGQREWILQRHLAGSTPAGAPIARLEKTVKAIEEMGQGKAGKRA